MATPLQRRHGSSHVPTGPWTPTASEEAISGPSWTHEGQYARDTSYVLIGVFLAAAAMGCVRRLRRSGVRGEHRVSQTLLRLPGSTRFLALIRALTYQKLPASKYWSSPSLGAIVIVIAVSAGEMAMCFGPHPYFWRNRLVGSPPLAVRAGMMATAMFPWFWGLALKVNPFTWLLGVSHDKLQVYHQWLARLVLFFSWVHTVPFLWQPGHDNAPGSISDEYKEDYSLYASGVAALVLMMWMCFTSTSWVRSLSYEFFVFQHLLCTFGVLICMFIHTGDLINSWDYLWATVAVWGLSTLLKWSRILVGSTFGCAFDASIEAADDGVMQIAVQTPLKWKPGQHAFLRFPTVNPATSHPFTISSLARDDARESLMVFVARSREGQTRTLYDAVRQTSRYGEVAERVGLISRLPSEPHPLSERMGGSEKAAEKDTVSEADSVGQTVQSIVLPAMIDGPYGEPIRVAQYPSTLLLAGGIGITRIVPALMEAIETGRKGRIPLRTVRLVWAMPNTALLPWFGASLKTAQGALEGMGIELKLDLCLTEPGLGEPDARTMGPQPAWNVHCARPDVPAIIEAWVGEADALGAHTVSIATCGPVGFVHAASSAAARENVRILLGKRKSVQEVILDEEVFTY